MSGLKLCIVIVALMAVGFCSAKFVEFHSIEARLKEVFAQGNGGGACHVCEIMVQVYDAVFPGQLPPQVTAEILADDLKDGCHNLPKTAAPEVLEFCKVIDEKGLDFAKAYIKHHDEKKGEPCKEVGIC